MAAADPLAGLTDEQRAAVETIDVGVAVSAGAGCGKTSVLTSRFLSHLKFVSAGGQNAGDDGAAAASLLRRLIAITFTDRAAREMRDRIRREVRKRLTTAAAETDADHWLDVLRRLESAQISTIHSFCGTLLRRHAVEAGLDPRYQLLKPHEAPTIIAELIDDDLRRRLADGDEGLIRLIADYDLSGVRRVLTFLIQQRYRLRWSDWLSASPVELTRRWAELHRTRVLPAIVAELQSESALTTVLQLIADSPPPHPFFLERCRTIVDLSERLHDCSHLRDVLIELRANAQLAGKGAPRKGWEDAEELKELYRTAFERLRKTIDDCEEYVSFAAAAALPAAEAGLDFVRIAAPIAEQYEEHKRQSSTLDFDDLLLKTRDLLCHPDQGELRKQTSQAILRMLVDECQDTDPLQKELIDALAAGEKSRAKLFLVGDFKQSIYRFRRADPQIFRDWRAATAARGQLTLSTNFRSQPEILRFVNALFGDYFGSAYEALAWNRPQATPLPAVEFMWAAPRAEEDRKWNADELRTIEADWIARWIRSRLDSQTPLIPRRDGGLHPLEPGDVALLFRSLNDAAAYEAALDRYEISYYVVGGKAFYGQQEIYDLLNLLRVLDSTCDEAALAGVLRSPFFSLRDDTLYLLAQHSGGLSGGLFAPALSDELSDEERRRAEFAATTIEDLRRLKNRLPIAALLNEILRRTAYDALLTAEFLGERKLANLHKLIEMARDFDGSQTASLTEFIAWLGESVAGQPDEAPAAVHAEKSPVVRLMTIHQSKGLEFPVVFLPDLQRKEQGDRAAAAFDREWGPLVNSPQDDAPDGLTLFRRLERRHNEEESVRLFYVAVTRAADLLILSSGVDPQQPHPVGWRAFLGKRFDLATGAYLGRHGADESPVVQVTTQRPPVANEPSEQSRRPDWEKQLKQARTQLPQADDAAERLAAPIAVSPDARRRYSFSRLSGELVVPNDLQEERLLIPGETSSPGLAGDVLGTLIHAVLATIDFAAPDDVDRLVRRQLAQVLGDGHSPEAMAYAQETAAVVRQFLASPRARSLAESRRLYRELEFVLTWPVADRPADEAPYLQGFLDCLYQDAAGQWHLIDYKTHRVTQADAARAAEPYRMQLYLYALATERILGRAPDSLAICFLRQDREYTLEWNDEARTAAVEFVNRSLAAKRT